MTQASAKRTSLLAGCGSAALALGLIFGPAPAAAQGIQATGNVTFGNATINNAVPSETTVVVSTPTTVIDWTPTEVNGNALDFLPSGNFAYFNNDPNSAVQGNYAVLNRILPSTNGNVAVINGTVISQIFQASGNSSVGGFIAFYSPTGILVGSNAFFDVGQLMLTTLDTTPASFDLFAQNGFGLTLQGAPGSTARIQIQPGAQIQALADNAFFAVVAADVEMRGSALVNGSHAYVAGEVVNLSFSNGLFNIQVPVGTGASGEVVTLDGTVGGPSSTGAGDNHLIYAVARASQDPISMLLRGNLGFDPAQSAGIVNGEIIISANYNVFGRTVDGGSISDGINATFSGNSELSTTRADIFLEDFTASSSLLAIGTHRTQVTARNAASSVAGNLLMVGRQNAELTASNGQNFIVTGDVLVSAQDYGVSGSGLQSLDVINATGGVAFIDAFGGGTLTINGSARVAADAFGGAESLSGTVGSATAGQALIGSTGGTLRINGDATVTARGVGPSSSSFFSSTLTGATARGGLAQFFSVQGGNVTLGGSLLLDASASATGSLGITTTTPSTAFGGNAFLNVFNGAGLITIGNGATVRANAQGGDARSAGGAGIGDAGVAIANVDGAGVIDITGGLTLEAFGTGGSNAGGTGGLGLGGRATSTINGGGQVIVRGDFSADASARGGNGVDGGDGLGGIAGGIANVGQLSILGSGFADASGSGGGAFFGFGGDGGIGRGGNAAFQAGGTLTQTARVAIDGDATVLADGFGGDGGQAFTQTDTPAGRGGDGFGGQFGTPNQADPAFSNGAFLLAGGDNGSIAVGGSAFVSAGATGGRGGSGDFLMDGGQGGNATGGLAQVGLALLGLNGSVGNGVADFGDVFVTTDAFGGGGGLSGDIETGNGGAGTGGFAAASVRAGTVSAGNLSLSALGFGGTGAVGGNGTGGSAAVLGSLGGALIADRVQAFADGTGGRSTVGASGNGLGGEAAIVIDGIDVIINGDVQLQADGEGGVSDGTVGGTGTGGLAYIASTDPALRGTISVTGNATVSASGLGGSTNTAFAAGDGAGGTAYVEALGGSTITLGSVQLLASGQGGFAQSHEGGNGFGGTARLQALGANSLVTILRNVPAPFSPIAPVSAAMIDVSGIGANTFGGDGIGGTGQGGSILVSAEAGGTVNLPVDILSDPARAADQLQFFAQGFGGDTAVDGGSGGLGRGGSITVRASGGTLLAGPTTISTFARGGTSIDPALNVNGGDAIGGSRTIRAVSNGNLTIETSDIAVPVAAQGGNGTGTGNGGNANAGNALFEVFNSVATLRGAFNLYNRAVGGSGRIGGAASGGSITVNALNATINAVSGVGGEGTIEIGGEMGGGFGTERGGDAFGGLVSINLDTTQLDARSLTINQSATGGPVSAATATGGNAGAGQILFSSTNSVINLASRLDVFANGFGGASGINAIGGAGGGGDVRLTFSETALTVGSAAQGTPGVIAISANGEGGQGGTVGAGSGGQASLDATLGAITTGDLSLSAQGRSVGAAGQIGGAANGGFASISLDDVISSGPPISFAGPLLTVGGGGLTPFGANGTGRIDATTITVDSSATTTSGGTASAGRSNFEIAGAATVVVNAGDLFVTSNASGADAGALGNRAGEFRISALGGNINLARLTATALGDNITLDPIGSRIQALGGNINVTNQLSATSFGNLVVSQSAGGIVGSTGTGATNTTVQLSTRGSLSIDGDGGSTGGLGGRNVLANAGRSIFISGTINATNNISLVANTGGGLALMQPAPSVFTMASGSRINGGGNGMVTISLNDGGSDPQRQTGAITLANISARLITVNQRGSTAGSDIVVLSDGVLTASGTGRAIELASFNGEVINNHGDAGLILTGGGHYGIYAATPTGSVIGSLANYARRYNVQTELAFDAINTGGNFAAFRITPVLTVTASDASRFYGSADPAFTANITGFLAGDSIADLTGVLQFLSGAGATSPVGQYVLNVAQGTLTSPQGYQFTFAPGILNVTPRPITITASNLSRVYGNANPALTFTVGGLGLVNGDQLGGALATSAGLTSGIGNYAITQGTLNASSNYALTFVGGQLTVTPRPITITAANLSRVYGDANPALTFAVGGLGLVNGDQLGGALATTAGLTSGVGSYAINQGSLTAGANYTITYVAGALSINPRPITITASNLSRVYGDANPTLTFVVGGNPATGAPGLVNGDQLTGALAAAGVTAGVGTSAITIGTLTAGPNYTIAFSPGVLTITPRPLTVAANNLSKSLGLPDPVLTFLITAGDLVNGDQLTGNLLREAGEGIGTFAIRQGTLSASDNYTLTFVPGTFTINPPPVSPEINNPTIFEPPVVIDSTPPPVAGESEERFGIDFPEQPDAPLISEDPLLDDPVATGGDSSVYATGETGTATPPAGDR